MIKSLPVLFSIFMFAASVSGQKAYFRNIRLPDELQQTSITCLYQSDNSNMWIGTGKGLYKFDGNDFVFFHGTQKQATLQVSALYKTSDQILWIGTRNGEIYQLEGDSLRLFNPEEGNPKVAITGFASDKSGNLWFSTYGEGVYYYDGKHIYNVNTDDGLTDNYCYTVIADEQGRIWAATDGGISVCNLVNSKKNIRKITSIEGLPDNIVLSLKLVGTEIWAGMQDAGICKVDIRTFKISVPKASEKWQNGPVTDIVAGNNWMWVSTERYGIIGIESSSGNINGNYTSYDGLNISRISHMYADKQGNYWIAAGSQLLLSLGYDLIQYISPEKPNGDNIHSLLINREGTIWYSNDDGLFSTDKQSRQKNEIKLPIDKRTHVISLYEDDRGYIWAGTFGSGLYCIDPKSKRIKLFSEPDGLSNGNILSISGKGNQLWLATLGGAYFCNMAGDPFAEGSKHVFINYGEKQFPGNNYIYSVFIDSRDRVWFGTDGNGITMLGKGRFTSFDKAQGLKSNVVYSIAEDSDGHIWFSTANAGIYRYDGKSLKNFSLENGLSDLHITGLLADKRHHLLIVHNNGVDIMDTRTNAFLYLSKGVGISALNPDLNVCTIEGNETAWLGTQNGLIRLQIPDDILTRQPSLQLSRVSVFLSKENYIGTHVFSYNQNHISFHFNAFWFIEPELVRYQIRLKGYDIDWIDTRNTLVTYSNLSPGDYTFEVRASVKGNFTLNDVKTFRFTIEKPFWKSTWFIMASIVVILLLVYLIIFTREKRLKQRDAIEHEKIAVKFQTLRSQVNPHFLFNSFSTLITIIDEDKEVAIEYVEKLSLFFRNILEYREDDLIPLSEELKLIETYFYLQKKRYSENLRLDIVVNEEALSSLIPPMVLQMLIENAIKHNVISAEKPLAVSIFTDEKFITISNKLQRKKDKEPSTGIGITNIRDRYALLGFGDIQIVSSCGQFTVKLPLIHFEK
ncbi:MAG: two-component regulator propeller domain-containing protein [Bacteroidales bacterium]|nr:two-component regulator propeller domain-containing protein [Bacteroidales bacterium]